jgi:2-polyprenyl-6-methoxyphenol hydroxylase-like FAD-dependent oxidoreductase
MRKPEQQSIAPGYSPTPPKIVYVSLNKYRTRRGSDLAQDLFCHRSDLHDELKRLAIGEGEGPPAQLHLDSNIVACDPEAGTVTLGNGDTIHADLVIGADGIHVRRQHS